VALRPPTPYPSPGEFGCDGEGVKPGEGVGIQGGGGPKAPRLLEDLHPLSATLGCVEDSFQAERGKGVRREAVLPNSPMSPGDGLSLGAPGGK